MSQLCAERTQTVPRQLATRHRAALAPRHESASVARESGPNGNGSHARRNGISAADAAAAEQGFLRGVQESLTASGQVWDLCRRTSVTVPNELRPTHRVNRLAAIRRTRFEYMRRWRWLDECPQGADILFDLRRYSWWGRLRGRVLVEVHSLARLERFAAKGYDDQPATRGEVERILNRSSRRAASEQLPHMVFLFSPTGWTAEAHDFVAGQGDSTFRDPLVSVSLFDENGVIVDRDIRVWSVHFVTGYGGPRRAPPALTALGVRGKSE